MAGYCYRPWVGGCSIRRDITGSPARMTDFVPGQVYELKQPVYLWEGSLFSRPIAGMETTFASGTRLVIKKVEFKRSFETGSYTNVYGEALSEDFRNRNINLSTISNRIQGGYTKRDPEMLVPVED